MTKYRTTRFIVGAPLAVRDACTAPEVAADPDQEKRDRAEARAIRKALRILEARCARGPVVGDVQSAKNYLRLTFAQESRECFSAVWLDGKNRALGLEVLAVGTQRAALVGLRDAAAAALEAHASGVIFAHNHPSGDWLPSEKDRDVTRRLAAAMSLIEVRMVDHLIVCGGGTFSFAESEPELLEC